MTKSAAANAAKPYAVNLWGSKPGTCDDCNTGQDFETVEEARRVYNACVAGDFRPFCEDVRPYPLESQEEAIMRRAGHSARSTVWVELDGPNVHEEARTKRADAVERRNRREAGQVDAEWCREQAMQAGMAFGVDGYNDEMGFCILALDE